jgi:hypothetical protein
MYSGPKIDLKFSANDHTPLSAWLDKSLEKLMPCFAEATTATPPGHTTSPG